jgi:ubiquinone/menaquinone biosynthesis C-methylase UbiE
MSEMKSEESDYTHIEEAYDFGSKEYGEYFKTPHEFIEPERQQFIQRLSAGSKILDCGCGPGMDTERFSQLGYNVTAIDLSERFVSLTKERVPTANVKKMDMRYLEFPPASFDGLWASFSLLHIHASDVEQTLLGFRRVLQSAGVLFVAVHRGLKTNWVKRIISGMERDTYVQEWLQTEIEEVVTSSGFTVLSSRPFLRTGGRYPLLSILAQG